MIRKFAENKNQRLLGVAHAYGYDECITPKELRNHEPHEHPGDQ